MDGLEARQKLTGMYADPARWQLFSDMQFAYLYLCLEAARFIPQGQGHSEPHGLSGPGDGGTGYSTEEQREC